MIKVRIKRSPFWDLYSESTKLQPEEILTRAAHVQEPVLNVVKGFLHGKEVFVVLDELNLVSEIAETAWVLILAAGFLRAIREPASMTVAVLDELEMEYIGRKPYETACSLLGIGAF